MIANMSGNEGSRFNRLGRVIEVGTLFLGLALLSLAIPGLKRTKRKVAREQLPLFGSSVPMLPAQPQQSIETYFQRLLREIKEDREARNQTYQKPPFPTPR